jgi:hypothetical protein
LIWCGFPDAVRWCSRIAVVLGYAGEISKVLEADHHGVCKYNRVEDPSYASIRKIPKSLVSKTFSSRRKPMD